MATKFYLRDEASGVAGTLPSAEQSTLTSDKDATTQADNLTLSTTKGTSTAAIVQYSTNANTNLQNHYIARYVSAPIYHLSIDTNTWTFAFAAFQGSSSANFPVSGTDQPVYVNCYVWRPSTGTKVGTILDGNTVSTVDEGAVNATVYHIVNFTGAQVTGLQWEDVIVFEVWFRVTPATASTHTLRFLHDGGTEYAENDTSASSAASNLSTPQSLVFEEPTSVLYQRTINEASVSIGASSIVSKRKRAIATQTVNIGASSIVLKAKRTMSETAISLDDTLTRILYAKRTITEGAISLLDSLLMKVKRAIAPQSLTVGSDSITQVYRQLRIIEEDAITEDDTMLVKPKRTIIEDPIALIDALDSKMLAKRTMDEDPITEDDSLSKTIRRTINEHAEQHYYSILTTSRGNFGSLATTTAGATQYWFVGNGMLFPSTIEAQKEIPWYTPGTFSKLYVRVIANTTTADSTVVLRKNGSDTAITITVPAGTSTVIEDITNLVTIVDGDTVCMKTVSGGTGTLTFSIISILFDHDDPTIITKHVEMGRAATTSNIVHYSQITGDRSGTSAVEANMETRVKKPGSYKNAYLFVSANTKITDTVVTFRKNRADTAITWTIAAGFTGIKENTTDSISVVVDDEVDWQTIYDLDTANITIILWAIDFESDDLYHHALAGTTGASADFTQDFGITNYVTIGGAIREHTVEADQAIKPRIPLTYGNLILHAQINTVNGDTTIKFRKNGADGNQIITIPAATAGWQEDDVNLDIVDEDDDINLEITTAGSSGTITIRNLSMMGLYSVAPQGVIIGPDSILSLRRGVATITEDPVSELDMIENRLSAFRTIVEEDVILVDDTITSIVRRVVSITESAISNLDSISVKVKRTIIETAFDILDSLTYMFRQTRVIDEDPIEPDDSIEKRLSSRRIINEPSFSMNDTFLLKVRVFLNEAAIVMDDIIDAVGQEFTATITEGAINTMDSISAKISRTISEAAESIADSISRTLGTAVTINEDPVEIDDTLAKRSSHKLTISESAVNLADSISLKIRHVVVESVVGISDALLKRLLAKRAISEEDVSIADDELSRLRRSQHTLTEEPTAVTDSTSKKEKKTVDDENEVSISDALTSHYRQRRTISEAVIEIADTIVDAFRRVKRSINDSICGDSGDGGDGDGDAGFGYQPKIRRY